MKLLKNIIISIILFIAIGFASSNKYEVIGQFNNYTLVQRKGDILMFHNIYFKPPIGSRIRLYFDWDCNYKSTPKLHDLLDQ